MESGGKYKEVEFGRLFTAETGDVDLQQKDINGKGELFINSGEQNFGIKGKTDRKAKIFPSNTITVDFLGNAYYRSTPYKLATHNHVFSLSGDVIKNERVGLYLVSTMSYLKKLFSYNNMGTWTVIKNLELKLPYNKDDNIAYNFMSDRMCEFEEQYLRKLDGWLRDAGLDNNKFTEEEATAIKGLSRVRMCKFRIGDLMEKAELKKLNKSFDKKRDLSTYPDAEHSIPITNAKFGDNGIMFWAKRGDFQTATMSIDIVQNGAVATGKVYPQPQETAVLWDSYLVELIDQTPTADILFYLATAMEKVLYPKYTYEYKAYWDKVKEDYILLPSTEDEQPDYHFMTIFISAVKKLVVKSVVDFIHSSQ